VPDAAFQKSTERRNDANADQIVVPVLEEEEPMQERIDAEEPFARQRDSA
jgi:hypothetical protein